jgi:DNA processing protein
MPDEAVYWSAWARIPGVGARRLSRLASHFGSLKSAWHAPAEALVALGLVKPDVLPAILSARAQLDPEAVWERDHQGGFRIVTRVQPDYPTRFWHLPDPPGVIWVMGEWPLPEEAVAIVGSRQASPYGERHARRLGGEFAEAGVLVVSGAAAGIDRAAHEGALEKGVTAAVLGCGLGHVYPSSHRALYRKILQKGALISEFPPGTPPQPGYFPMRNRLIAALVYGVLVVEARKRSGSLITADLALELGREVFAVPGPAGEPGSEGPHMLLRSGAALAESAADVLNALGWHASPAPLSTQPKLPEEALRLLQCLGDVPVSFDVLSGYAGLPPAKLGVLLTTLEMEGAVRALSGGRYVRG